MGNEGRPSRSTDKGRRAKVKIVDLSRELYHRTPSYPGHPPVMHGVWKTHEESLSSPAMCTGWPRCSSRWSTMPAPISTHPGISARAAFPSTNIRWKNASCPASASISRHIAPRAEITPADLEAAVAKTGVPVPRAAPCCSAPDIMRGHSRARRFHRQFRREAAPRPPRGRRRALGGRRVRRRRRPRSPRRRVGAALIAAAASRRPRVIAMARSPRGGVRGGNGGGGGGGGGGVIAAAAAAAAAAA